MRRSIAITNVDLLNFSNEFSDQELSPSDSILSSLQEEIDLKPPNENNDSDFIAHDQKTEIAWYKSQLRLFEYIQKQQSTHSRPPPQFLSYTTQLLHEISQANTSKHNNNNGMSNCLNDLS